MISVQDAALLSLKASGKLGAVRSPTVVVTQLSCISGDMSDNSADATPCLQILTFKINRISSTKRPSGIVTKQARAFVESRQFPRAGGDGERMAHLQAHATIPFFNLASWLSPLSSPKQSSKSLHSRQLGAEQREKPSASQSLR